MDTIILAGIGLAALGYVLRLARRSLRGETACGCGGCSGKGCGTAGQSCHNKVQP